MRSCGSRLAPVGQPFVESRGDSPQTAQRGFHAAGFHRGFHGNDGFRASCDQATAIIMQIVQRVFRSLVVFLGVR